MCLYFSFLRSGFPSGYSPIGSPILASELCNPFSVLSGLLDTSLIIVLLAYELNWDGQPDHGRVWVVPNFSPFL